jgi:predicted transcriptional regulator
MEGIMKAEHPLFETADPKSEAAADARADADVHAGRLISHQAVRRWLASWGSKRPAPRPRSGD